MPLADLFLESAVLALHGPPRAAAWIDPLLAAIGLYFLFGLVVGGFGLLRLAPRADPALGESGWSLRLLLLPGSVAVWPLAIRRWSRDARASGTAS